MKSFYGAPIKRLRFLAFLGFIGCGVVGFLYWQTAKRVPSLIPSEVEQKVATDQLEGPFGEREKHPKPAPSTDLVSSSAKKILPDDVWCRARDYVDLSKHPAILAFDDWLKEIGSLECEKLQGCSEHDPRTIFSLLDKGESLARARKEVFLEIMRGDPRKALQTAVSRKTLEVLPGRITRHLEKWESAFADIDAIHVCYDPEHPRGLIKRFAKLDDGRNLRIWTFGERKTFPSVKGLAVWGISLEEDFSVSDKPFELSSGTSGQPQILIGGENIDYPGEVEMELFAYSVGKAEARLRRAGRRAQYPIIMSSSGGARSPAQIVNAYEVVDKEKNFSAALSHAVENNATLAKIDSQEIQSLLLRYAKKELDQASRWGRKTDHSLVWIGGTGNADQNGSRYDSAQKKEAQFDINASSGNWKWMDGTLISDGFENWKTARPGTEEGAVLDWNHSSGGWESKPLKEELPFVMERRKPAADEITTDLRGIRKILVIPGRFIDQTEHYTSQYGAAGYGSSESNALQTNELGEPVSHEMHAEPFLPLSYEAIEQTMKDVADFYARNTDGELKLLPVITPAVTIPTYISTYKKATDANGSGHLFDSNGLTAEIKVDHKTGEEMAFAEQAKKLIANRSEEWDFDGPAFFGVSSIAMNEELVGGNYESPPSITFEGGAWINPITFLPHANFEPAKAEVLLNEDGNITKITVTDPGAYYFNQSLGAGLDFLNPSMTIFDYNYLADDLELPEDRSPLYKYRDLCEHLDSDGDGFAEKNLVTPRIKINGDTSFDDNFTIAVNNVCLTWVVLTTYSGGAPGMGYLGQPGAHVVATQSESGEFSSGIATTVTHEVGHNIGLNHAQRYVTHGESSLSDEGYKLEYGNHLSVMGNATRITNGHGDLTLAGKYQLNEFFNGEGGYRLGLSEGVDIVGLSGDKNLNDSQDLEEETGPYTPENTFRIYRHNTMHPPRFLREGNFSIKLEEEEVAFLDARFETNSSARIRINGTGSEANGSFDREATGEYVLRITEGGRGYTEEPTIEVIDTNGSFFTLNSSWIQEANGIGPDSLVRATLLDMSRDARWVRGARVTTSRKNLGVFSPSGFDEQDHQLVDYYLAFRTDFSVSGLTLLASTAYFSTANGDDSLRSPESFLIDATPQTPTNIEDGALLVGRTYSDYDADLHFTPIRTGGNEYLEKIQLIESTELPSLQKQVDHLTIRSNYYRTLVTRYPDQASYKLELEIIKQELAEKQAILDSRMETIQRLENTGMPYLEVVINKDTMRNGEAKAPSFELMVTNNAPEVGEYVEMAILVKDSNLSQYAYSWYVNEVGQSNPSELNKPYLNRTFSSPGNQVVRVVVSDMKGGVASRTAIIAVGNEKSLNRSMITGTVRSGQGLVQGARVVVQPAPVINHTMGLSGNLYDSYFFGSDADPLRLQIDGEIAPDLHLRKGEIHRFYLDPTLRQLEGSNSTLSFLELPEKAPPQVAARMTTSPQVMKGGNLYLENPQVHYTTRSTFSKSESQSVGTYLDLLEFLDDLNGSVSLKDVNGSTDLLEFLIQNSSTLTSFDENHTSIISHPYPRAIMQSSGISKGVVGPLELSELGFRKFGGYGYDRDQTPVVKVRRSSIWDDYQEANASARAFVDGVGTISPVISTDPETKNPSFLGNSWQTRPEADSNNPKLPQVVVWGTGGENTKDDPYREVNATVYAGDGEDRYIFIYNQGKGFEPNATMAVLHYPQEPFAYWTFDRHESLFENSDTSRYQPTPAWNRPAYQGDLIHHWAFDEENGTEILDSKTLASVSTSFDINSSWGLKGRALSLPAGAGNEITFTDPAFTPDLNFTLSFWVLAKNDYEIDFNGLDITYDHDDNRKYSMNGSDINRTDSFNDWAHVAIVHEDLVTTLFVDGLSLMESGNLDFFKNAGEFVFTASGDTLLLDECRMYRGALGYDQVLYLAGRTYLDLSGNKFHLVPMGSVAIPSEPGLFGSSSDVPESVALTPSGSGRLGDTYKNEGNGHSLNFNGADDYLSLIPHKDQFGLPEGTISLWLKISQAQTGTVPLVWLSSPYEAVTFVDPENNSTNIAIQPGKSFSFEVVGGLPRVAGQSTFRAINRVNDNEWHHLAASFPDGQIWIDGEPAQTQPTSIVPLLFEEADNTLEFISDVTDFYVGASLDYVDPEKAHFLEGNLDDLAIYDRILTNDEVSYLYGLAKGREQLPRLEALVDAVGTVEVSDPGAGYRENPDLEFGYGEHETLEDLNASAGVGAFTDLLSLNVPHGTLRYVRAEDAVYVYYEGKDSSKLYSWREDDTMSSGWRKLGSAFGYASFEGVPVGDVVWSKRMPMPIELPLPDGRVVRKRFVDYVTIDPLLAFDLERNKSLQWGWKNSYYKPNGLYGFAHAPDFSVAQPGLHNYELTAAESLENTSEAYALFYIDKDSEDSREILFGGAGLSAATQIFEQVRVFGTGYQPDWIKFKYGDSLEITTPKQDHEDELNGLPLGAEIDVNNTSGLVSLNEKLFTFDWNGSHDLNLTGLEFNHTISSVTLANPGFGYSMPAELKVIKGFPQQGNHLYMDEYELFLAAHPYIFAIADEDRGRSPVSEYDFIEAEAHISKVDENGSIVDINITNPGKGYVPYYVFYRVVRSFERETGYDAFNPQYFFHKPGYDHPSGDTSLVRLPSDFYTYEPLDGAPLIAVTGGGGSGALMWTKLDTDGIITAWGFVRDPKTGKEMRGRGYFNIDPANVPRASLSDNALIAANGETNASVTLRLGGYLKEIPPCTACTDGLHGEANNKYSHLEPWVEIWDLGRSEAFIDANGSRAHAAPKVRNGKIKKVVVTESGAGYVDPVVFIRDAPPYSPRYYDKDTKDFRRIWVCTFERMTQSGSLEQCGHKHYSLYPPEECPGETDEEFPYLDANGSLYLPTGKEIADWRLRHFPVAPAMPWEHWHCEKEGTHHDVEFAARKCWGTKINFVLDENASVYRNPRPDFISLDLEANLSVIAKEGRIMEVIVDHEGSNYLASEIHVVGTGTGVDAIPVFNQYGVNTRVIFDDPRLKNWELDKIDRPLGAGQGFRERPWAWEAKHKTDYYPSAPPMDAVQVFVQRSQVPGTEDGGWFAGDSTGYENWYFGDYYHGLAWNFGDPVLADSLGDRILDIEVNQSGLYGNLDSRLDYNVTIDYNSTARITLSDGSTIDWEPDFDGDGKGDFMPAEAFARSNLELTSFKFDGNATFQEEPSKEIGPVDMGMFSEHPTVQILDGRNLGEWARSSEAALTDEGRPITREDGPYSEMVHPDWRIDYEEENISKMDFIRLNGDVFYDPERDQSYIELYVDDRFPNSFYYGLGVAIDENATAFPKAGGKIIVSEGLPGDQWFVNEPESKGAYAYTDQYGAYAISNLMPGLYNVAVFMEDNEFEETTFRPEANRTRVSQLLYLPGFPELVMETDNSGPGSSNLVWSREARKFSRGHSEFTDTFAPEYSDDPVFGHGVTPHEATEENKPTSEYLGEFDLEYRMKKELRGIGRGFDPKGPVPELTFIPHPDNISLVEPRVIVRVLLDGSLSLQIIDDENTTNYYPQDRFTVMHSVNLAGLDFFESNLYSKSSETFWSGALASWDYNDSATGHDRYQPKARLVISPGEGNGANVIEVPLATKEFRESNETHTHSDRNTTFTARVFDSNGTELSLAEDNVSWSLEFDFNASEGEESNSKIARLFGAKGANGLEVNGTSVELCLFSTLRTGTGQVHGFEIVSPGTGYTDGILVELDGAGYGFIGYLETNATGSIVDVNITGQGIGYSRTDRVILNEANQSAEGGLIRPIFAKGELTLHASFNNGELKSSVRIKPSPRSALNEREFWLDRYLDTFFERNASWWEKDLNGTNAFEDLDDDNLTNFEEWKFGSHPNSGDFDGDELFDADEKTQKSSPWLQDTDGDGLSDKVEFDEGANPRMVDTDKDGLTDFEEWEANLEGAGLDLNKADAGLGEISARVYRVKSAYPRNFYLEFNSSSISQMSDDFSAASADKNGTTFPSGFYWNKLVLDRNYSLRAFIDLDGDQNYSSWEPYAAWEGNLTKDRKTAFGLQLKLKDPDPDIHFTNPAFQEITINNPFPMMLKDGTISSSWEFESNWTTWTVIEANDSALVDPLLNPSGTWTLEDEESNYTIHVSGDFLEYLNQSTDGNFSRPPTITDPENLEVRDNDEYYQLFYQAEDEWGNLSELLEQKIRVRDTLAPVVKFEVPSPGFGLPSYTERNATWILPGLKGSFLEFDPDKNISVNDWDENAQYEVVLSFEGHSAELIDLSVLGDYNLTVRAYDSYGNEDNVTIIMQVVDVDAPQITIEGIDPLGKAYGLVGESMDMPVIQASDDFNASSQYTVSIPAGLVIDDNGTVISDGSAVYEANVTIGEILAYILTPLEENNFTIELNATDGINHREANFTLVVEEPEIVVDIVALDGYLAGAKLVVDTLQSTGFDKLEKETNGSGHFILRLSETDFNILDADGNGVLGYDENIIISTGGTDLNTGSAFPGTLKGKLPEEKNGNLAVVSPLSTFVIQVMESSGKYTWAEAESAVRSSFGIGEGANLFTFDPLSEAMESNASTPSVLAATLRIGSWMSLAESFVIALDPNYEIGKSSLAFLSQAAALINESDDFTQSISAAEFEALLELTINDGTVNSSDYVTSSQLEYMGEIMAEADDAWLRLYHGGDFDSTENRIAEFVENQAFIHERVIQRIATDISSDMTDMTNQIVADLVTIQYPGSENRSWPRGENFRRSLQNETWVDGYCIQNVFAFDADGDYVRKYLISGNFDFDLDGRPAFKLSESGKLCVEDADDLIPVAGQSIRLVVRLDDGRGKYSEVEGIIEIAESTPMQASQVADSWYDSEWFGYFYLGGQNWIYHLKLGWLHYAPDGSGGYWIWDDLWESWWWSNPDVFPWIYRDDQEEWSYIYIDNKTIRTYDGKQKLWRRRR